MLDVAVKRERQALILVRSANNGVMGLLWENLSPRERKYGLKICLKWVSNSHTLHIQDR